MKIQTTNCHFFRQLRLRLEQHRSIQVFNQALVYILENSKFKQIILVIIFLKKLSIVHILFLNSKSIRCISICWQRRFNFNNNIQFQKQILNMKKKLDLNGLLSKYQGISNNANPVYHSPTRGYDYGKDATGFQDFYQSRQTNMVPQQIQFNQHSNGNYNFQTSKSQCQSFLLKIKDELRGHQRQIHNIIENTHKHIHERFQNNHERIRRQILELLDKAFQQNEKYITEQLKLQGNVQPEEFKPVHRQIALIDEEINQLLYGLKGTQFRQSISKTVLRDFGNDISNIGKTILQARQQYVNTLGQVQPDTSKIQCIRNDLERLFKISKKNQQIPQGSSYFNSLNVPIQARQSQQLPVQGQASTRQRKSFFNFMSGS